ncbi:MAG: hypothetical protein ACOH5I_00815 [Oligoflexus sp.]
MKPNVSGKPLVGSEVMTFPTRGSKIVPVSPVDQQKYEVSSASIMADELPGKNPDENLHIPLFDLQKYLRVQKLAMKDEKEDAIDNITLINLNYFTNSWYLLRIKWPNQKNIEWYHLENPDPKRSHFILDASFPGGIIIETLNSQRSLCDLWSVEGGFRIKLAKFRKQPFSDLCHEKVYLRNRIEGYRTTKEWVVEFLRDRVWGGETITNIVKNTIYKDKFLIDGDKNEAAVTKELISEVKTNQLMPGNAKLSERYEGRLITANDFGVEIKDVKDDLMLLGKWYPSKHQPGAYLSIMEAQAAHESILSSHKKYVRELDDIEGKALSYLIAFDLDQFQVNFSIGTEHPRVDWSERVDEKYRDPELAGPDGFTDINPLIGTGLIPGNHAKNIVATFTGGFKRSHAAFKWGPLAKTNFGHHYGFMENGVVLSRLQNHLASIIVYNDDRVTMKTWQESDLEQLHTMRHVRQNGVPVLRWDEELEQGVPGEFVSNWTLGNWSGSQDMKFRSLRAGMCLQTTPVGKKFLIYGYFSSVTPTAMARVFQAYGCDYAMHLDMNALEHTYLALYAADKTKDSTPSHLIKGMKVLDQRFRGNVPRFIGYPDNRDFFYLIRRDKN